MSEFSEILNHPYQLLGISWDQPESLGYHGVTAKFSIGLSFRSARVSTPCLAVRRSRHDSEVVEMPMAEMTAGSTKNQNQRPQPSRPAEHHLEVSRVLGPGKARGSRPTAHWSWRKFRGMILTEFQDPKIELRCYVVNVKPYPGDIYPYRALT